MEVRGGQYPFVGSNAIIQHSRHFMLSAETIINRDNDTRCPFSNDSTPGIFTVQISEEISTAMEVYCKWKLLSSCSWRRIDTNGNSIGGVVSSFDGGIWWWSLACKDGTECGVLVDYILCRSTENWTLAESFLVLSGSSVSGDGEKGRKFYLEPFWSIAIFSKRIHLGIIARSSLFASAKLKIVV
jgi:hypothetical protein